MPSSSEPKLGDVLDAATLVVQCTHPKTDGWSTCVGCGSIKQKTWVRPELLQRLADALGIP